MLLLPIIVRVVLSVVVLGGSAAIVSFFFWKLHQLGKQYDKYQAEEIMGRYLDIARGAALLLVLALLYISAPVLISFVAMPQLITARKPLAGECVALAIYTIFPLVALIVTRFWTRLPLLVRLKAPPSLIYALFAALYLTAFFGSLSAILLQQGLSTLSHPVQPAHLVFAAEKFYLWHLGNAVVLSALEIWNLNLANPLTDNVSRALAIAYEVVCIAPLIAVGAEWWGIVRHAPAAIRAEEPAASRREATLEAGIPDDVPKQQRRGS